MNSTRYLQLLICFATLTLPLKLYSQALPPPFVCKECHFEGASNTSGFSASLSMQVRFEYYLYKHVSQETQQLLQKQKVLIAFDYFYPTKSTWLRSAVSTRDAEDRVKQQVAKWLAEYSQLIIGTLPLRDEFEDPSVLQAFPEIKTLYDTLSLAPIRKNAHRVNDLLRLLAKNNPQRIHLIEMNDLVRTVHDDEAAATGFFARTHYPSFNQMLYRDGIHLNDLGQAFVFDGFVIPQLRNIFALNEQELPSLPSEEFSKLQDSQVDEAMSLVSGKPEEFSQAISQSYRLEFADADQFRAEHATLHLPDLTPIQMSDSDLVQKGIEGISDKVLADKAQIITNIAHIIDRNFSGKKTFLSDFSFDGAQPSTISGVSLNLISALSYVNIPLSPAIGTKETLTGWGYDHWQSYIFTGSRHIPGTNYFFKLTVGGASKKPTLQLKWRIYPTMAGQADELERLDNIPEPYKTRLAKDPEAYPYVEYNIDLILR